MQRACIALRVVTKRVYTVIWQVIQKWMLYLQLSVGFHLL